ncbi:hypothetical protein XANCAGTX0491_005742 [Xanthoria calcicola]
MSQIDFKTFRIPIAIGIAAVSLYTARKSYTAIINLRRYEERSERAARYSETAAQELQKTRTTQASSAGAVSFIYIGHEPGLSLSSAL